MHFPLLGELFLPEAWTSDRRRLRQAGVPPEKEQFQEKWKLALALLDQFRTALSYEASVMDARYGEIRVFWHALDEQEQLFVAQIPESHCFWLATVAVETGARHVCLAPQPGMPSAAGRLVHCEAQILALALQQVADLE